MLFSLFEELEVPELKCYKCDSDTEFLQDTWEYKCIQCGKIHNFPEPEIDWEYEYGA